MGFWEAFKIRLGIEAAGCVGCLVWFIVIVMAIGGCMAIFGN